MNIAHNIANNTHIYYRLIALWVVCEAFLGGMIHGLKLPVSGLVVGSSAVFCICLIGYYANSTGAILKATIVVAICKMMLSPQAPPPAYIAVFFQGLIGQLLFSSKRFFKAACLLLGFLSLTESAMQRILVMTIIYGRDVWTVVNEFITKVLGAQGDMNYSLWLIAAYILLHALVGVAVGWLSIEVIKRSEQWKKEIGQPLSIAADHSSASGRRTRYFKRSRVMLLTVWLLLLALFFQSYLGIGEPIVPTHVSLQIFLRSVLIISTWIIFINPLIKRVMQRWLSKRRSANASTVEQVVKLIPSMQQAVIQSWRSSAGLTGIERLRSCCKMLLIYTLTVPSSDK